MLAAALFSLGILLTPLVGLLCFRLLLRTGWPTDCSRRRRSDHRPVGPGDASRGGSRATVER